MRYSDARIYMATGDAILWKGSSILQKAIRLFADDFSHSSIVVRSKDDGHRVKILEAVGSGVVYRYLSDKLAFSHGEMWWIPMFTPPQAAEIIKEGAADMVAGCIAYDYQTTISFRAMLGKMLLQDDKLNCSETFWALHRDAENVEPVYDSKGRELAPTPGQIPQWVGMQPIRIEMD